MNKLTNAEISARIRSFRDIKDPCERAIALAQFEPDYKQTQFYKTTKRSLQSLYYEVVTEDILTLNTILQNFQNFINQLDAEKIIAMFDEVNDKTLDTVKAGLADFESSDLMSLLHSTKR